MTDNGNEILVTFHIVFPTPDRGAVAAQIGPILEPLIAAGGRSLNVSIQSYSNDEEDPGDE